MTMTLAQADIVVRNPQGRTVAVVEVKERPALTPAGAVQVYHQWVTVSGSPPPYFVLLSPDTAFVWKCDGSRCDDRPAAVLPMQRIISRYWPSRQDGNRIRHGQLELIGRVWLMDLVQAYSEELGSDPESELVRIGFVDAVHGGSIAAGSGA
jgi:hypothetical protein